MEKAQAKKQLRVLLIGGLLPVAAFALVEQFYGTMGGLIAGIIFGTGEIIYEYVRDKKVSGITLASNVLVLILGLVSLWEGSGVWFKLQPAVLLVAFAVLLFATSLTGKPFLLALALKQNPNLPDLAKTRISGMNFRLGFVFLAIAGLSVEAAIHWSTAAWATLKAVGVPVILVLYMVGEVLWVRLCRR
jgi:intracellular septation protein